MSNVLVLFILVFSVFFSGCGRSGRGPQVTTMDKESPVIITIDNFEVTDKTLTIDYRVTNNFDEGIWVCYDAGVYGKQDVQHVATRTYNETVRIQLRCNLESVGGFVLENPPGVAKYVRLLHGESCSGRITRDLPIGDYVREWRAERKEHRDIMLHRAVFEVGYFGPELNEYFASVAERCKKDPNESKPLVLGPFYYMSGLPFITEEPLDGQLREVMYTEDYVSLIRKEESAEILITGVDIPCVEVIGGPYKEPPPGAGG